MEMIERIRERFLNEFQLNPELYHEIDVNRVRNDNWQIERFMTNDDEEQAFNALMKAMRWKKSYGVHDRGDQYFPKEFFELTESEIYGRDREGRVIRWASGKNSRSIPEIRDLLLQFIVHEIEKLDTMASRDGYIMITDASGMGLSSVDLEANKFMAELLQSYYPKGMRCSIVVNLPWILNSIFKIVLSFMNQEIRSSVKFLNTQAIIDYVDYETIPVHLGGKRLVNKRTIPDEVMPLGQSPHLGLTDKQINSFYEVYNKIFNKK